MSNVVNKLRYWQTVLLNSSDQAVGTSWKKGEWTLFLVKYCYLKVVEIPTLDSHLVKLLATIFSVQLIEHPKICYMFQSAEAEEQLIQSLQSKPKNGSAREFEVHT